MGRMILDGSREMGVGEGRMIWGRGVGRWG